MFYPSARPRSTGSSRAETIPRTTSSVNTNKATDATRAPSDHKRSSKTSNARTGEQRPTSRGHFTITPSCLALDHRQPVGFAMYPGISFGIWGCVATRQLAMQPTPSHPGAITDLGPRDSKSAPKECNRKHIQHEGFFQLNVHCPQKRWRLEAHNKSKVPRCLPGSL